MATVAGSSRPALPLFDVDDVLPAGDYLLTVGELRTSHLVTGAGNPSATWDAEHRLWLVDNLELLVVQLWDVGIDDIFVDGSFVENKDHPHDIDGYFVVDERSFLTGEIQRELNARDPYKSWTWDVRDRRPYGNSAKLQLPMWHNYRVELYPHYRGAMSGILDRHGHEKNFPSAFRQRRYDDHVKGIVRIMRDSGP